MGERRHHPRHHRRRRHLERAELGDRRDLCGVAFTDATHGWAVGEDGTILATTDGGATWSAQSSGTSESLYDVAFTDATHGWAVGEGGTILATSDGGATWSAQSSGSSTWLHGVAFSDATHGWAVGEGGTILATTQRRRHLERAELGHAARGSTASPSPTPLTAGRWAATAPSSPPPTAAPPGARRARGPPSGLAGVAFTDATHGWAVGDGGTILATTDGGATWSAQSSGTTVDLGAVAFTDATHGWAVGDGGTILVTANGGATWSAQSLAPGAGTISEDGTSMAAPHVTGAVALCAARFPSETVAQRVQRVLSHVDQLATLSGKTSTGGRLDVAAALTLAGVAQHRELKPAAAKRGAVVTLTGTGFGTREGTGVVKFGTRKCTMYMSWNDTRIKCRVPANARYGAVKVTVTSPAGVSDAVELHGEAVAACCASYGRHCAAPREARTMFLRVHG